MKKSKVYFINLRTTAKENLLQKLKRMLNRAGMMDMDFAKKMVAIKIHFGEPGNLSYIRPNFAAQVVKMIQEKDGLVFLTDANTLYKGRRSNAVDHLQAAMENGFNPIALGCNIVIADGIKGTDYREIEINQQHCKKAKIGSAIADSDIIISMNHFKGHEMASFGGCLKNLGMGCGSIGGKLEMHSNSQPIISRENCVGCKMCVKNCNQDAIHLDAEKKAVIQYDICVGCGQCIAVCLYDAAQVEWEVQKMQEKIAEYALAALKDKPSFHINFLLDISPNCDCWPNNDMAIVPNIGILCSTDPVALDQASADLITKSPTNESSCIGDHNHINEDKFTLIFPKTDWNQCLSHAEKIGLGSRSYELEELDA